MIVLSKLSHNLKHAKRGHGHDRIALLILFGHKLTFLPSHIVSFCFTFLFP